MVSDAFFVRAGLLRSLCVTARRYEATALAAVADRIEAQLAVAHGWLPGELYASFHEEAFAALGERRLYELCRRSVALTPDDPIMSKFLALARALSRGNPLAFFRFVPGSRAVLFRNGGETSLLRESAHGVVIEMSGLDGRLAGSVAWRIGSAGALHGIVELAGRAGVVRVLESPAASRSASFQVRWWVSRGESVST